ncbi:secreted protein [Melampsora americana]|nr:secreted protein [Melampsora americana]
MKQSFVIIFFLALYSGALAADKDRKPNEFRKVATLACTNGNTPKGLTSIACSEKGALSCRNNTIACPNKQKVVFQPEKFDIKGKGVCADKEIVGCMEALVPPTCVASRK